MWWLQGGVCLKGSLLCWAKMLSFSLCWSDFSPSILARSTWLRLSSAFTSLILGVTSGRSWTLASSAFWAAIVCLVAVIRFWLSMSSICFSLKAWLMSSICNEPHGYAWTGSTSDLTRLDSEYLKKHIFSTLFWKAKSPLWVFGPADPASVCSLEWRPWWPPSDKKLTVVSMVYVLHIFMLLTFKHRFSFNNSFWRIFLDFFLSCKHHITVINKLNYVKPQNCSQLRS